MNDLLDLRDFWEKCVTLWRNAFGAVLLAVIAYFVGAAVQQKEIVDDCKFAGVFRDGPQPYSCQQVMRLPRS